MHTIAQTLPTIDKIGFTMLSYVEILTVKFFIFIKFNSEQYRSVHTITHIFTLVINIYKTPIKVTKYFTFMGVLYILYRSTSSADKL